MLSTLVRLRSAALIALTGVAPVVSAQRISATPSSIPYQISFGYDYLSNSFNGVPGSRQPLNGWDAAVAFPAWHNIRFKIDYSSYSGTNLGAQQKAFFLLGGGQYEWNLRRERFFVQGLAGEGGINRDWGANGARGGTASFATLVGGGVDTAISRHLGFRVEGDFQHTNFALIESVADPVPYRSAGLPNYFGHIGAGIVWLPRVTRGETGEISSGAHSRVPSEVVFEGLNSFGHYHVFAYTWWSYLHVGGVEYDRASWGKFLGAQMDYVAEILPVAILTQPKHTDVFGDPLGTKKTTIAGLGISPIGLRLMWRDEKEWKPYYSIKGGMIGFTQKALSNQGSYENFTLQQSIGMQFRVKGRWDFRAGISDFHFSNGFIVPNNPGIDEMSYNGGLSYHLTRKSEEAK
ncbi:MAG: acyloxyacyl hydrolase [Acidobacteriota bacterium]